MARALVTNDDGIDAPGLHVLAAAAVRAGLDVVVAAPAEEASGASASVTSVRRNGGTPFHPRELPGLPGVPAFAVQAQPAYIVFAALAGWLDPAPDVVLSGVNLGANVGRSVLHSGTVGAALTAALRGVSGLAVSLDVPLRPVREPCWPAVDGVLAVVLELLLAAPPATVLSLNVPDRPAAEHGELREAALAEFGTVQADVEGRDGHLRVAVGLGGEPEPGSDTALLAAGHPTLTALRGVSRDLGTLVTDWLASR